MPLKIIDNLDSFPSPWTSITLPFPNNECSTSNHLKILNLKLNFGNPFNVSNKSASKFVLDQADAEHIAAIEKLGLKCIATETVIPDQMKSAKLCSTILSTFFPEVIKEWILKFSQYTDYQR